MPASVTDADGKPVSGLRAGDFAGWLGGNPVLVLSARTDNSPRIVLLLDASGSMAPNEVSKPALAVARDLVERLPPEHPVSFFVFAAEVEKMVDFTLEREPVLQQIDALQSGSKVLRMGFGATSLWDTVTEALASLGTPHVGDAIYAITDGGDNRSHVYLANLEKALVSAGVRFFAILPPPPHRRLSPEEDRGPENLFELAQTTGGLLLRSYTTRFLPLDSNQLGAELDLLYNWTFHFYRLEIQPTEHFDKIRDWRLQLLNSQDSGKPNHVLGYPHKIVPCATRGNAG